jgi:hypothetical protein
MFLEGTICKASTSEEVIFDVQFRSDGDSMNVLQDTGCFKKSFTTLIARINFFREHVQLFELSLCSKKKNTPSFTWDSYGSM